MKIMILSSLDDIEDLEKKCKNEVTGFSALIASLLFEH